MFNIKFKNAVPQCLTKKLIRQKQLHIEKNHIVVRPNIQYYPHSEIISIGTLNATFPEFSHAQLTLYITGDNQGC